MDSALRTLAAGLAASFVIPSVAEPQGEAAGNSNTTSVELSTGRRLTLAGAWRQCDALWPDAALVVPDVGIAVLESGAAEPRIVYREPWGHREGNTLGILFSRDATTCFAWLDHAKQLTAIDVKGTALTPLLKLPTHVWNYEGLQHLDPAPVLRPHLMFEEDSRLLLLLQEESNDEVAPWQRRAGRKGGHWLVSIPSRGPSAPPETPPATVEQWHGRAYAWDFSRKRGELYLLVDEERKGGRARLRVRRLDGSLVDRQRLEMPLWLSGMALSPDERWLLLEHGVKDGEGDASPASGPPARKLGPDEIAVTLVESRACFVVIDLENGGAIDVADGGHECIWAPDSKTVTYLRDWELVRLDLDTLAQSRLAWREPSQPGAKPSYYAPATWSPDGNRLWMNLGGNIYTPPESEDRSLLDRLLHEPKQVRDIQTLVLDFPRHEFLVLPEYLRDAVWSPIAHPFKKDE